MLKKLVNMMAVACFSMTMSCDGMNNKDNNDSQRNYSGGIVCSVISVVNESMNNVLQNASNADIIEAITEHYTNYGHYNAHLTHRVLEMAEPCLSMWLAESNPNYTEAQREIELTSLLRSLGNATQLALIAAHPALNQIIVDATAGSNK